MRAATKELIYILSLVGTTAIISKFVWLLPLVIVLPIILTYTVDSPLLYLAALGIITEVFTFLPFGIMFAVVLSPWVIGKFFGKQKVDVSFLFGIIVVLSVLLQAILMFLPDIYATNNILVVPWLTLLPMVLTSSVVAFLTSVAIYFNRSW